MNEDFLTKIWADQHGTVTTDLAKLFAVIGKSLKRLNALQFDAPWERDIAADARRRECATGCAER